MTRRGTWVPPGPSRKIGTCPSRGLCRAGNCSRTQSTSNMLALLAGGWAFLPYANPLPSGMSFQGEAGSVHVIPRSTAPMNNPFLVGKQIYLRPLEREDAPQIVPWLNDPEVSLHLRMYRPLTRRAEEEFLDKLAQQDFDLGLGIVVAQTDRLIGACGLHRTDLRNRHAEFG